MTRLICVSYLLVVVFGNSPFIALVLFRETIFSRNTGLQQNDKELRRVSSSWLLFPFIIASSHLTLSLNVLVPRGNASEMYLLKGECEFRRRCLLSLLLSAAQGRAEEGKKRISLSIAGVTCNNSSFSNSSFLSLSLAPYFHPFKLLIILACSRSSCVRK